MWAGPDAPEVYFLADAQNHTRTLFDFFDADSVATRPLPQRLADGGVEVVVVKLAPPFSPALADSTLAALALAYPNVRTVGDAFLVRWR